MPNDTIRANIKTCQDELHRWGDANQVAFDAGKESEHVLSLSDPASCGFLLLGIEFDGVLAMVDAVDRVVTEAGWKLRTLLRTRRFYNDSEMIMLYKAHLLSNLEYRTPAVYHATRDVLNRIDNIQHRFLRDAGVDELSALFDFHLAPLRTRRDMAMLGVIHRSVLGKGPPHFKEFFKRADVNSAPRRHRFHLIDVRGTAPTSNLIVRSAFGLIGVYNLLPERVVSARSVKIFQHNLQALVKERAYS